MKGTACGYGDIALCEKLIARGVDIKTRSTFDGGTALHRATKGG